jgi:hypothetical protein
MRTSKQVLRLKCSLDGKMLVLGGKKRLTWWAKAPHLVGKAPHLVGKAPHLVGKAHHYKAHHYKAHHYKAHHYKAHHLVEKSSYLIAKLYLAAHSCKTCHFFQTVSLVELDITYF